MVILFHTYKEKLMSKVISINLSENRGTNKYPVKEGIFIEGFGMKGDGHSGDWHRQVSIFSVLSLENLSKLEKELCEESYSENITIDEIQIHELPIGTIMEIGDCEFQITQIGKPFERDPATHTKREIIMHSQGVFATVKKGGVIKIGDNVLIRRS
jgi:MOSC domain-containing protein YiiM